MSNLDVCAFAHEGKFKEVHDRIEAQPDLVKKKDQVSKSCSNDSLTVNR